MGWVMGQRNRTSLRLSKLFFGGVVLMLASGCTSTEELTALQNEPAYIAGFSDGCATARESEKSFSTKRVRDEAAFADDRAYQAGWRSGLLECNYRFEDDTSNGGRILGENQNF